jgi:hypothetical protein
MRVLVLLVAGACGRVGFDARVDASANANADAKTDGATSLDLTTGLVGWWKLDDAAGVQAVDSSPSSDTGTLTAGITWVSGHSAGAIDIDGGVDHDIDLGNPAVLHLTGSVTLAAWVNARSFHLGTVQDDAIVSRDDFNRGVLGWSLKGTEDCNNVQTFSIQIAINATSNVERCSTMTPAYGVWYHVAGVYDAAHQTMDIYVNGALDNGMLTGVVPSSQYSPTTTIHAQIGNTQPPVADSGGPEPWDGQLDDIRIYDRALGSAEVAALASL